jgi:hypothetical protein
VRKKKTLLPAKPSRPHWRRVALELFPEHKEIILSDDEEYAIYNLFFQIRGQFTDATTTRNTDTAAQLLNFAGRCLQNEFASDGEDISVAAGVSVFEHVFEDCPASLWPVVFSCMPLKVYHASRHDVERWVGADAFSRVADAAKKYYASRKRSL